MEIRFLRHATMVFGWPGARVMVDPMLSPAGAMEPVKNAGNDRRIPLVDLPLDPGALAAELAMLTGVMVTHTHRDHWDEAAATLLAKDLPVLCPPGEETVLRSRGFTAVTVVDAEAAWQGAAVTRTGGRHGLGEVGKSMGPVSGYVLRPPGGPRVYVAGDTIFCDEVGEVLAKWSPRVVVVNAGAAAFLEGGPITMTAEDVVSVCRAAPEAVVVAVHMEAVNHCGLDRAGLRRHLAAEGLAERVLIPRDGDALAF